jgi:hypothetical protein
MFQMRSVRRLEGGFAVVAAWLLVWWLAAAEAEASRKSAVLAEADGPVVAAGFARD